MMAGKDKGSPSISLAVPYREGGHKAHLVLDTQPGVDPSVRVVRVQTHQTTVEMKIRRSSGGWILEGGRTVSGPDLSHQEMHRLTFALSFLIGREQDSDHQLTFETNANIDPKALGLLRIEDAPVGLPTRDIKKDTKTSAKLIKALLKEESVPPAVWKAAANEIREAVKRAKLGSTESNQLRSQIRKAPVPHLEGKQVKELVRFGNRNPYSGRLKSDERTPFEWVRDEYARWYPGVLMHHLKEADEALWVILQKRRSRARSGKYPLPKWFNVPTKEENDYRAATPEERGRIDATRALWRSANRARRMP
jgi:hypothetical protein